METAKLYTRRNNPLYGYIIGKVKSDGLGPVVETIRMSLLNKMLNFQTYYMWDRWVTMGLFA